MVMHLVRDTGFTYVITRVVTVTYFNALSMIICMYFNN